MRIGRLRHRVAVWERQITQDSTGAAVEQWTTLGSFWAEVRTRTGTEAQSPAERLVAVNVHQVTMRRQPGITFAPTMRLMWATRVFEITAVGEPDNRQRMVVLDCYEIVA